MTGHSENWFPSADDLALYLENGSTLYYANDGEEYEMGVMERALTGLGYIIAHWFYKLCFPFAIPEPSARR